MNDATRVLGGLTVLDGGTVLGGTCTGKVRWLRGAPLGRTGRRRYPDAFGRDILQQNRKPASRPRSATQPQGTLLRKLKLVLGNTSPESSLTHRVYDLHIRQRSEQNGTFCYSRRSNPPVAHTWNGPATHRNRLHSTQAALPVRDPWPKYVVPNTRSTALSLAPRTARARSMAFRIGLVDPISSSSVRWEASWVPL